MTTPTDPLREAFRRRAMGAVDRMVREAPAETLVAAMAASTDTGTLARATADQAATEALQRLEPLAGAIARGAEVRARLVDAAGGLLSAEKAGTLLGITRAAVDKRRAAGRLLALRVRGDWAYPAAQFRDGEVLDGIPEVVASMADASPWSILDFLMAPDDVLEGQAPIVALRGSGLSAVQRLLASRQADVFA
jgi:hypothetical protein